MIVITERFIAVTEIRNVFFQISLPRRAETSRFALYKWLIVHGEWSFSRTHMSRHTPGLLEVHEIT